MKFTTAIAALAGIAAATNANVTINEVLGSTASSDTEFIELYNTSGAAIDLTGWSIELWDSDVDSTGFMGGAIGPVSMQFVAGPKFVPDGIGGPDWAIAPIHLLGVR